MVHHLMMHTSPNIKRCRQPELNTMRQSSSERSLAKVNTREVTHSLWTWKGLSSLQLPGGRYNYGEGVSGKVKRVLLAASLTAWTLGNWAVLPAMLFYSHVSAFLCSLNTIDLFLALSCGSQHCFILTCDNW